MAVKRAAAPNMATFQRNLQREFAGRMIPALELKLPPNGVKARGVVIAVHGGGWSTVGRDTLSSMHADADRWRSRGYAVVNVDYRAGRDSVRDVVDFYDAVRKTVGRHVPVGMVGQSAGGHLALMTAAWRPGLDFAESLGGPTDLSGASSTGPDFVRDLGLRAFGESQLAANSPIAKAGAIRGQVLLAHELHDPLVSVGQAEAMKRARPKRTSLVTLKAGDTPFVHAKVAASDLAKLHRAEVAMMVRAERDRAKRR